MIPWLELSPDPRLPRRSGIDDLRAAAKDWANRQLNARVLAEYRGASHGGIDAEELVTIPRAALVPAKHREVA